MNYLTNDRNLVREAALSATNVVASRVYYRVDEVEKQGGGTVSLEGDFTGAVDRVIDVEVLDEGSSLRNVSAPTFSGTGNGAMTGITAGLGVDPQEFVVTLKDLGTATRAARTPFQGSAIVAREAGADGNLITISVSHAGITAVQSADYLYSLQAPLQAGVNEYTGAHLWNFRTPYLNADGTIPADAPRIRFGDDPQVYRPYKRRVGAQDVFSFSPAPVRDADIGTPLKVVTGTYSITVSDGTDTQTLTGIVTVYDALVALQGADLVTVEGVGPILDRAPGGQASVDFSLWTSPYVAQVLRSGTVYAEDAELGMTVGAGAPAETLSIECVDMSVAGAERWRVSGPVSGTLSQAITGVLYERGGYAFTIPVPAVADEGVVGEISVRFNRPGADEAVTLLPNFKATQARLGIGAKNGTYVFRYAPRPVFCDAEGEVVGGPSIACLGLNPPPEEGDVPMSDALRLRRMQRLSEFLHDFIKKNTRTPPVGGVLVRDQTNTWNGASSQSGLTTSTESRYSPVAEQDILFVNRAGSILSALLRKLAPPAATLEHPGWTTGMAVTPAMTIMRVVSGVPYRFTADDIGGVAGASEPSWTAVKGATFVDNGVIWTNVGKMPFQMWDDLLALLQSDVQLLEGMVEMAGREAPGGNESAPFVDLTHATIRGNDIEVGRFCQAIAIDGTDRFQVLLRCTVAGEAGASAPTVSSPDLGTPVVDGAATWEVVASQLIMLDSNRDEGDVETVPVSPPMEGGGVFPQFHTRFKIPDAYYERYSSMGNAILSAAGIDPRFEESSSLIGDGCWTDFPDIPMSFRCVTPDANYAPIFPNVYYHSVIKRTTDDGAEFYVTTSEFGFGPQIGCPELLAPGDELIVDVRNVNGISTYQVNDRFDAQVVRAEPLALAGGQTGNDTITWSVIGGDGALADYAIDLTSPAQYSSGGLGFTITPGAIPFGLGAQFRFAVQAARAQWRVDGGPWSAPVTIGAAPVVLVDGLAALFTEGVSPSWVPGDRTTFRAQAINGVDNIRSPIDARLAWTGSTVIEIEGGPIEGVMLGDHAIPSDATITLTGSDDGFATTPLSVVVPWRRDSAWLEVIANHAEYRLIVNRGGTLNWLWMGDPLQLAMQNGVVEWGALTMRYRLPGIGRRGGLGVAAAHAGVAQAAFDEWFESIASACRLDQRRIGVVPVETSPEAAVVTIDADSISVEDVHRYQPVNPADRLLSFTVDLAPIA